ncbi:hypothetical protein QBC40DRAFT_345816 [Triangularia verruculosa]|uniref:Uncharacterized protein n=1 Tax=Triangularia verruculosa TaxID=2587418 RepID=A0AAN6XUK8_9PEZI|nr:hypothetical protein QBC40DRAFT_345816 [Triangularia verruculosa]
MKAPITERPTIDEQPPYKPATANIQLDLLRGHHVRPENMLIRDPLEEDAENNTMRRWLRLTYLPYKLWSIMDWMIFGRSYNQEDYFPAMRQSLMPPTRDFRYLVQSYQTTHGYEPDDAPWEIIVRCLLVEPPSTVGKAPGMESLVNWRSHPVASSSIKNTCLMYRYKAGCPCEGKTCGCCCRPYRTWGRRMVYSQQSPSKTHLTGEWLVAVYLFSDDRKFVERANLGEMVARWPSNDTEAQMIKMSVEAFMLPSDGPIWHRFLDCESLVSLESSESYRDCGPLQQACYRVTRRRKTPDEHLQGIMRIYGVDSRVFQKEDASKGGFW